MRRTPSPPHVAPKAQRAESLPRLNALIYRPCRAVLKECVASEEASLVRKGKLPPLHPLEGDRSSNGFALLATSYTNLGAGAAALRSPHAQYFRHRTDVTTPDFSARGCLATSGAAKERLAFQETYALPSTAPHLGRFLKETHAVQMQTMAAGADRGRHE